MKKLIIGMALCAAAFPALAQVSVSIGEPGFYGRINVGGFAPAPVLYAPRPVIIAPGPGYGGAPIYLRVPPAHRLHWARWCGYYQACGLPVLFVRDDWYTRSYVPAYRRHFGPGRFEGYRGGPGYGHGYGRPEFHDRGGPGGWEHGRGGEFHGGGEGRGRGEERGEHGDRGGDRGGDHHR